MLAFFVSMHSITLLKFCAKILVEHANQLYVCHNVFLQGTFECEASQKYLVHFCLEKWNQIEEFICAFPLLKKENRRHAVQNLGLGIHLEEITFKLCKMLAFVTLQCRVCFDLGHTILATIHTTLTVLINFVRIFNHSLVCYDIS